jgi:hypothetical protein
VCLKGIPESGPADNSKNWTRFIGLNASIQRTGDARKANQSNTAGLDGANNSSFHRSSTSSRRTFGIPSAARTGHKLMIISHSRRGRPKGLRFICATAIRSVLPLNISGSIVFGRIREALPAQVNARWMNGLDRIISDESSPQQDPQC